jgi:large subunit ribosomal protein L9
MEIILKEDVKNLGYKNDLVKVRNGFGLNYLIPQGLAIMATDGNKKMLAENLKQVAHKAEKVLTAAKDVAAKIGDAVLEIKAKSGESGKIFGAVTSLQISDALKAKGIDVDRKRISFDSDVKMLGTYTATINLHKEVSHKVTFNVIEE